MKDTAATLLQLFAALSRLQLHLPGDAAAPPDRRNLLLGIERGCDLITCFVEERLQQLRGRQDTRRWPSMICAAPPSISAAASTGRPKPRNRGRRTKSGGRMVLSELP